MAETAARIYPGQPPFWFARIGSHAERDVMQYTAGVFDGVAFNGNLVEATPGACFALLANRLAKPKPIPFFIDPMTHAFALPPHYLLSERLNRRTGTTETTPKRTFTRLADRFGHPFQIAIGESSLTPEDIQRHADHRSIVERVIEYQMTILDSQRTEDDEDVPVQPTAVIPPYFCVTNTDDEGWLPINRYLARLTTDLHHGPVYPVICLDKRLLQESNSIQDLLSAYLDIECPGYFLWISNFPENEAGVEEIRAVRHIVESLLSRGRDVVGYFSGALGLALGLTGIVHAVGYGEWKDVVPVLGGGPVRARFYYPPLKRFLPYSEAHGLVRTLSVREYRNSVCNCSVCQDFILTSVAEDFSIFGELEVHGPAAFGRQSQTKRSIEASRLHFASNRYRELELVRSSGPQALIAEFYDAIHTLGPRLGAHNLGHLATWLNALG